MSFLFYFKWTASALLGVIYGTFNKKIRACLCNIYLVKWTMTGRDLIRLLKEKGWQLDRVEGSHHILKRGDKTLSVPVHGSKDLGKGLLNALMKQGGLK